MNNNINKNVMKRKITTIFVVFCFVITNVLYVRPVNAFTDINQLLANVVNWSDKITTVIDGIAGGVLKSTLSTVLNQFAKDFGQQTVNNIASGDNGQEPLYFNLSLQDTLMAVADNAVGGWLDKIGTEKQLDLCKPIDAVDVNWKFKIMLNIIPDLNSTDTATKYNCTVSKFIESAKTSINNMITSVQNTFGQECFSNFLPEDVSGAAMSLVSSMGGAFTFDINGFKNLYGYDTSTVFCKKTTYYLKSNDVAPVIDSTIASLFSGMSINKDIFINENWTTSKTDCNKWSLTKEKDVSFKLLSSNISANILRINDGNCLVAANYCRFDNNGNVIYDRAKRKSFIDQYNNCYVPKVKETLGGLLQLSGINNNEDVANAEIKNRCKDNVEALFNESLRSGMSEKYKKMVEVILKGLEYDEDNKFAFFITRKLSPLLYFNADFKDDFFTDIVSEDEGAVTEEAGSLLLGNKVAVWEASSWDDFYKRANFNNSSSTRLYDVLYYDSNPSDEYINMVYNNNGKVIVLNTHEFATGNKNTIQQMNDKKDYMIQACSSINSMNTNEYIAMEQAADRKKIAKAKADAEAEKQKAEEIAKAENPISTGFKAVKEPVSKQVVTPEPAVKNQFETSLNLGSNLLQPTGDLIIDPIKIFLSTILSEGSNALFDGLFQNILPEAKYTVDNEDIDLNEYLNGETDNTCDNADDPSKFSDYTPCGANYQCKSCCCTTNPTTNYGIMYCYPQEYCK